MTINQTVKLVAHCKRYEADAASLGEGENVTLDLELKEMDLCRFLFKFMPSIFQLGAYKVAYSDINGKPNYAFYKDEDVYVVVNPQQFISELINGYERLRVSARLQNIFDVEENYWAAEANDSEEPVDEFDVDEDKLVKDPEQEVLHEQVDQMDDSMEEVNEQGINVMQLQNGKWVDPVLLINREDLQ